MNRWLVVWAGLALVACGSVASLSVDQTVDAGGGDGATGGGSNDASENSPDGTVPDGTGWVLLDAAAVDSPESTPADSPSADSGADVTSPCSVPAPVKHVFITSQTYDGWQVGTDASPPSAYADSECQRLANNAQLSGTYKAWLSDDSSSPSARFTQNAGPYVLVGGATLVACGWSGLGALVHPIDTMENGQKVTNSNACSGGTNMLGQSVWTGTTSSGARVNSGSGPQSGYADCQNWTTNAGSWLGVYGCTSFTGDGWTQQTAYMPCNHLNSLYCFEQ
jgi:hypothetical protein